MIRHIGILLPLVAMVAAPAPSNHMVLVEYLTSTPRNLSDEWVTPLEDHHHHHQEDALLDFDTLSFAMGNDSITTKSMLLFVAHDTSATESMFPLMGSYPLFYESHGVFALFGLMVVAIVMALCRHLYLDMTVLKPTTANLAKDLETDIPILLQWIGLVCDALCPWTPFDVSQPHVLLQRGALSAGLPPVYAPQVVTSLERLCDSIRDNQVQFHFFGRWIMHCTIVTGLAQYLHVEEAFRKNPALADTPLNQPLFVAGLPRSGTTFLHRVLCTAPDSYSPPLWEHFYPVPPSPSFFGGDWRRWLFYLQFPAWRFLARKYGIDSIHFVDPDEADECNFSLRVGGATHLYWVMAPVHDYIQWLISGNEESTECLIHSYETYRKLVLIWQSQHPDKRLVLKSPSHALHLQKLVRAIPEANLILTHRGNSVDLIASEVSLFSRLHKTLTDSIDMHKSALFTVLKTFKYSENMVDFALQYPDQRLFHSSYEKLISSQPIQLVRETHRAFGIPVSPEFERILENFLRQNKQHSRGTHRYDPDATVFSREEILKEGLGRYRAYYSAYLGGK